MIKKYISFRIKYSLLLFFKKFKSLSYFKETKIDVNKSQCYIFLAADYGNLGDVAITYAQTKFIKEHTNLQIVEIPISQSLEGLWFVKKHIKNSDVITTVGGGNMGDLYDQIEFIRQLVIEFFPNNRIISFPQTFDFSETNRGIKSLAIAKRIYNKHLDFHIVAREKNSFESMRIHFFNAHVILTPDIVLSLNESIPKLTRKGVVICMRKDSEKALTTEQSDFILRTAKKHFCDLRYYDTHIGKQNMSIAERDEELNAIWIAFKSAELVITDRLHGMIFCHITGTPALVFQNNNHKVRETYHWIRESKGITLQTDFSESTLNNFFENPNFKTEFDNEQFKHHYKPLIELLKG